MVGSLFEQPHPHLDRDRIVESTLKTPTDIGIAMLVLDIFGADRSAPLARLDKPALVIASASSPLLDLPHIEGHHARTTVRGSLA